VIDIFMMSVKCGNCDSYQTIVKFRKGRRRTSTRTSARTRSAIPNVTRTIVEVPKHLDNSTRRAEELPVLLARRRRDGRSEDAPADRLRGSPDSRRIERS
jgi:hypothetical protein